VSTDPYSSRVRALFAQPAHAGTLEGPYRAAVNDQNLRIRLFATLENDRIAALRFKAWACPHVIAAAEAFCTEFEGRPMEELLDFSTSDLMQSLPVPVEKTGRILVLEDAVRSLGSVVRETSNPDSEED
jgi:NifU-like protein involved in Fe-S cluster formation